MHECFIADTPRRHRVRSLPAPLYYRGRSVLHDIFIPDTMRLKKRLLASISMIISIYRVQVKKKGTQVLIIVTVHEILYITKKWWIC